MESDAQTQSIRISSDSEALLQSNHVTANALRLQSSSRERDALRVAIISTHCP